MMNTTDYSLLFGRFYPEYAIAVSLLWVFIILSGVGNWVVMWCILKTKSLRNPFNMMVLGLAIANGLATTVVGPMDFIRTLMAHNEVTVHWCNARVLLKTFCFSISIMTIFVLSVLRLKAALSSTPQKLTYVKTVTIMACIYCLALLTAPVFLNKTSPIFRSCIGNVKHDLLREILQNEGLLSSERIHASTVNQATNDFGYTQSSTHDEELNQFALTQEVEEGISTTVGIFNITRPNEVVSQPNDLVGQKNIPLWMYYLLFVSSLYLGTITCYISIVIILRRYNNELHGMQLSNAKDILTMRVTAYVTCIVFISFLFPFFPALIRPYPQRTAANLHYVSIFHCLSYLDGALTPTVYYLSNPVYRLTLLKALPHCIKRCCVQNNQIAPMPPAPPNPPPVSNDLVLVPGCPHV